MITLDQIRADLYNLVTKKVVCEKTKKDLVQQRSLFARLMMVCKSRPDIDIKETIGLYEFTVFPRSLFASDGIMMQCSCKSTLMHIPEKQCGESSTISIGSGDVTVVIVDGMAEVQSLDKLHWIKTCKDLAEHFIARLFVKYNNTQQIRLIFDGYDVLSWLKSASRRKRQGTQEPIYNHITDSTHIAKVTLKKLISHTKNKAELTAFLAQRVMERGEATGKKVVVAWATECKATHKDVSHLQSDHKEADTKIILHALDASADGATELSIYSPETDALVLAIRRYTEVCPNTLVKCKCAKKRCSTNGCQCRKAGLLCTDLCSCSEDDVECENQPGGCDDDDDSDTRSPWLLVILRIKRIMKIR